MCAVSTWRCSLPLRKSDHSVSDSGVSATSMCATRGQRRFASAFLAALGMMKTRASVSNSGISASMDRPYANVPHVFGLQIVDRLQIHLWAAHSARVGLWWNHDNRNRQSSYWRLYCNDRDGAWLEV